MTLLAAPPPNASQWLAQLDDPASDLRRKLADLNGHEIAESLRTHRRALETFIAHFGAVRPVWVVRSPGRVNMMGMHIDHRGGATNTIAVKELVFVAAARQDDLIRLRNVEADRFGPAQFRIAECLPTDRIADWEAWTRAEANRRSRAEAGNWANYVKASVLYLQDTLRPAEKLLHGFDAAVASSLPTAAGMSSSSALVVASALAVDRMHGLRIERLELARRCGEAEWFVGTRGGMGDHTSILCGRPGCITHVRLFPVSVAHVPFPADYALVICNSLKEAHKQGDARSVFNSRIACYQFGLMLIRKHFPEHASRLEYFRDINPERLGVDDAWLYRAIAMLPQRVTREQLNAILPEQRGDLERLYQTHQPPPDGYPVRQVCVFGIAECLRSALAPQLLQSGDIAAFAEFMNISQRADTVTRLEDGRRVPVDNSVSDDDLRAWAAAAERGDPAGAFVHRPGGYDCSCEELDELVEIVMQVNGVEAARLVGAGLGGSIEALARRGAVERVRRAVEQHYYSPHTLPLAAEAYHPVAGACSLTD